MDAETKLVPTFTVGKRTEETTWYFVTDLADRLASRVQLTTDGFAFYQRHVEDAFGCEIDFAQLVKLYGDYGQQRKREVLPMANRGDDIQDSIWRP